MNEKSKLMAASDVLTDYAEQAPSEKEQIKSYKGYLQMDKETAKELAEIEQTSSVNDKFESFSDDEIENLYEQALNVEDEQRSEEQDALLEQTKERYLRIKFYREFEDAARWFETEYPEMNFSKIAESNDFLEFAAGIKLPIRELIRRFVKMSGTKNTAPSTGSVKNYGTTVEKDYFTPTEVDRMSEEEIEKNLENIKKSMRKWK